MEQLCREIDMPEEVAEILVKLDRTHHFPDNTENIMSPDTWAEGYRTLQGELGPDPQGFLMLCFQLRYAMKAKGNYLSLGLSEDIYVDTMAAFSRFVREYHDSFGKYGFDRGYWTVRQISCRLFRIGQLEYELSAWNSKNVIELHIPSDANLEPAELRASWLRAKAVLRQCFPDYADAPIVCESWLLSPVLSQLLPEKSRILQFQKSFAIHDMGSGSDVLQWVFKRTDLPLEELPEETSLQRRLKRFLLNGGIFVDGVGTLSDTPFI